MKYIKFFESKPEIEIKEREWYMDFYFDDKNKLIYIDNKWDVKLDKYQYDY